MTAEYGVTQEGKRSKHTLANTGPRRYLVCEFDQGTFATLSRSGQILHLDPLTVRCDARWEAGQREGADGVLPEPGWGSFSWGQSVGIKRSKRFSYPTEATDIEPSQMRPN